MDTSMGGPVAAFPSTRWTAILSARDSEDPAYRQNLEYLIQLYWKPVYRYARVGWSKSNEDAKDLTQEFFLSLLARESLKDVGPEKGRFRSFLKAALKNFLMQDKRDSGRQKRGGDARIVPIECDGIEPDDSRTPDEAYDREWANSVLDQSVKRLGEQIDKTAFQMFQKFYFSDGEQLSYEQLAEQFKMSKFDVGNRLKAARTKLREIALQIIGEYDEDRDGELADLFGGTL